MVLVADNSVIIAWFARSRATAYTDKIFRQLERDELVAPSVWPHEFANALALLERRRVLGRALADEISAKAAQLVTRIDAPPASASILLALAREHGLSAYDAAYLELAQRLKARLAAKDSPLAQAASKLGLLAT